MKYHKKNLLVTFVNILYPTEYVSSVQVKHIMRNGSPKTLVLDFVSFISQTQY